MKTKYFLLATLLPALILNQFGTNKPQGESTRKDIYHDGWIDLNKNGRMDTYEDPKADIESRITDLLSQMTLEEKTCQTATLYGYNRVLKDELPTPEWKNQIWKDGIANIDEHQAAEVTPIMHPPSQLHGLADMGFAELSARVIAITSLDGFHDLSLVIRHWSFVSLQASDK